MRRTKTAAALLISLTLPLIVGRIAAEPDPFLARIEEISQTPQTHGTEHLDELVALGAEAVPAIGAVLLSGPTFPITFVEALERIGDERGAAPIVEFISKQAPYSDGDRSTLTARSIQALRGVKNPAVCDPVVSILRDETAHPRVRLAAASTCANLCSGHIRAEAQRFVLDAYDNRSRYTADANRGFSEQELFPALIDVDNEESLAILLGVLEAGAPGYIALPVVDYLAGKQDARAASGLERAVHDSYNYEPYVRLAMARALLDGAGSRAQSLRLAIDELFDEATRGGYAKEIIDEAQRLKARAAQL